MIIPGEEELGEQRTCRKCGETWPLDGEFWRRTSHWYENTRRELRLYANKVRPGGLIVCHDTELPSPEGARPSDPVYPVKTAIREFIAETGFRWINIPECWGLGIIEVV